MSGGRELRDQQALDLTEAIGAAGKVLRERHPEITNATIVRSVIAAAESLRPEMQRHLDAAREQTAEDIAQAIEADPLVGHANTCHQVLLKAARIARQHAKGDGDE